MEGAQHDHGAKKEHSPSEEGAAEVNRDHKQRTQETFNNNRNDRPKE